MFEEYEKIFDENIEFNSFAALVRYERTKRNMTQAELATACGVSRSAVANWESNLKMPTRLNMRLLVKILRIDMAKYYILLI